MNKQAYEKSVGYALSKQADFDWKSLWDGFKQHFKDNAKHYRRAAYVGIPAMILGGAFGGRQGVGLGLLASIATGLGSKGWDWYTSQQRQPDPAEQYPDQYADKQPQSNP